MTEQPKLYKVLTAEGESMHGGSLKWSLPRKRGKGYTPGKWHEAEGEIVVCSNGLHLTTQPGKWWKWNAVVWEAQGDGDCDADGDKIAFRRARLLKPVQEPAYISKAREFVATIPNVKWFTPDSPPDPTWKVFATRDAAWAAAWAAARAAAWAAAWAAARDAARDAAWAAARDAAWDAAGDAAWAAARAAARAAAGDAAWAAAWAAAWTAARDARLMVLVESICSDLDIDQRDRQHARARWDVWQRGYGLLCDVNGVLYVYEKWA